MTTHRKVLHRRAAAVGAFALALAGFMPSAAQADDDTPITTYSSSQCTSGRFCLWDASGYTGSFWSTGSAGVQSTGVSATRSLWNRMAVAVRVYENTGGTGPFICYDAGDILSSVSLTSRSVRTMNSSTC